jgi:hypothetical protein
VAPGPFDVEISDGRQLAGFMVPARRRVFLRGPDGEALIGGPMTVSLDLGEIAFR